MGRILLINIDERPATLIVYYGVRNFERKGPDGKKVRVSDDDNFRRREKQIGALQWRLSKLKPKRYRWE